MEERKLPAVSDSSIDSDLDDLVTRPGPCKTAHFMKPLNEKQNSCLTWKRVPLPLWIVSGDMHLIIFPGCMRFI